MEYVDLDIPSMLVSGFSSATEQMVGFPLICCDEKIDVKEAKHVQIQSRGGFRSVMRFHMEHSFMKAVLQGMLCKDEQDPYIRDLYVGEYINVLSGHVLTLINNAVGETSRLTVPTIGTEKMLEGIQYEHNFEVSFTSKYGKMQLEMSYEI